MNFTFLQQTHFTNRLSFPFSENTCRYQQNQCIFQLKYLLSKSSVQKFAHLHRLEHKTFFMITQTSKETAFRGGTDALWAV